MTARVSAYVPCFNNSNTLAAALTSIQTQTHVVDELFVIDDGSTDDSAKIAAAMKVRLIRHESNLGRGAARARAMREARHEYVLCCDATNVLHPDFVKNALRWFQDSNVAAVFGGITQRTARNAVDRWRGRHLFKLHAEPEKVKHRVKLATFGAMVRASCASAVHGYSPELRFGEDNDLGDRFLAKGWDVVCDRNLEVFSIETNTFQQVCERYWRWHAKQSIRRTWRGYFKEIVYSMKVMALEDLKAGDWGSVVISVICPHYIFWRLAKR